MTRGLRVLLMTMSFISACGGGGSGGVNRGSQCRQVMTTYCNRAAKDCSLFPTSQVQACIQSGITSCCAGSCGAAVVSTQQDIDACDVAITGATCASLDVMSGGSLPAVCVGVVQSALQSSSASALTAAPVESDPGARAGALLSQ